MVVLMRSLSQVVFKKLYPAEYTADVSTRVSNALLVGKRRCVWKSVGG